MSAIRPRVVAPHINATVLGHPAIARLAGETELVLHQDQPANLDELCNRLAGAQVFFNPRLYLPVTAELLPRLPDLLLVVTLGVGVDTVDLEAATAHGVAVCNAPGVNSASVAEHTIGLLLATTRHIARMDRAMRAGRWEYYETPELEGKTLGVAGLGNIGQRVARIGGALGMRLIAWSRTPDPARAAACGVTEVDQATLLRESDAVVLCVAASPETRGMIDAAALQAMKPGAVLINTGRGSLVDEAALIEALREGRLAGAGLDVFSTEPLPPGSPLRELENVVLTPHAAWVSREARERTITTPVENILAFAAGNPVNVVNPEALAHPRQQAWRASCSGGGV